MTSSVKKKTPRKNQFVKGNTASKGYGRPKLSPEQKLLRLKTRTEFKDMLEKYMLQDITDLKKLIKSDKIPALDAMIIKSLIKTFESGDQTGINWFLNHALGAPKVETNINLKGSMENTSTIDLKSLTKEELLVLQQIAEKGKK